MNDWEDADLFSEDDHSESLIQSPPIPALPSQSSQGPQATQITKPRPLRRIRVKPMSAGMRLKWPEVATCLLTLDNGRQIMFVR